MQSGNPGSTDANQMDTAGYFRFVIGDELCPGKGVLGLQSNQRLPEQIGQEKGLRVPQQSIGPGRSRLARPAEVDGDDDRAFLHQFFDCTAGSAIDVLASFVQIKVCIAPGFCG